MSVDRLVLWVCILPIVLNVVLIVLYRTVDLTRGLVVSVDRLVLWVCILPIVLNVVLLVLYRTVDSTRGTGSVSWQVSIVGLYFTNCIECCFISVVHYS